MSNGDRGEFTVKLEGEPQNTLRQTSLLTEKVEDILLKKPEVTKVFSNVGYSSTGFGNGSSEQNKSEITVTIVPKKERKISVDEYATDIKKELLATIPGVKVSATPTSMMGNADDAPIQVLLRGPITDSLFQVGDRIIKEINKVPGITDVKFSIEKTKPELQIKLDREKMELLGISVQKLGKVINLAYAGNTDLQYSDKGTDYDINVKFDEINRKKIEDLNSLTILNDKGEAIELRNFATVTQTLAANKLERYDRVSSLTVKANVFGRPVGTVGNEVKAVIAKINTGNVTVDYKGQMERQSDAFSSLFNALFAAIIFVYLVMVALYNSYLYPFVVLFSLPVALIGSLFALALSGEYLTVFSIIGMIMLMGLVAKNAILIVDFANKQRE
jgi:HAE1 family hydrophobic/amphiphilic exporter-1